MKKYGRNRISPENYENLKSQNQLDFDYGITTFRTTIKAA